MTKTIFCRYCQGTGNKYIGLLAIAAFVTCDKCLGNGYILIAERKEPKPAHNRPQGSYPRHLKFD